MSAPEVPLRILMVEDSADDAELMGRALLDGGLVNELHVVDGEAGFLSELALWVPEVLVIDWHLPKYSAGSAIAVARAWDPDVPCILVSGAIGEELVVEALRTGATDYVLKHHLEALAPAVRRAVAECTARRQAARLEVERGRAEAARLESERLLNQMAEVAHMGGWAINVHGQTLGWTKETFRIHELPESLQPDVAGAVNFYHPDDRALVAAAVEGTMATGNPFDLEARLITAAGNERWVRAMGNAMTADGVVTGVHGMIQDVTDRHELEERLRQSQKMEAVGRLAGGIAHDFNNMLTAITGYAEFARVSSPPDSPVREDLSQVLLAARRAATLTSQLLAFSRKQVLVPRVIEPAVVIEGLAPMLRRVLGEHIELVTTCGDDPGWVKVDAGQLEQVIVNLAVNARDAMPGGGRLVIGTANVELDGPAAIKDHPVPADSYLRITIADSGMGMDAAILARAFEPFFTTKAVGEGTGMGLATVYGIVTQSGGQIACESEPGRGTTFTIDFPRLAAPDAIAESGPTRLAPRGTETILLVEDEESVRHLARRVLTELGYVVLEAASGAEALDVVGTADPAATPIDLLLTDVVMPGLQGDELARRISVLRPDVRILLMSGFTSDRLATTPCTPDPIDFLRKPFDARTLAVAVHEALGRPAPN